VIDFGETFSSPNYEIRDANGNLGNAGTLNDPAGIQATLTKPDGTLANPTLVNPTAGVYTFDYLTTQAGRHQVLISATGGVLGTLVRRWVDTFDVREAEPGFLISLEDAKTHLNITGNQWNEELRSFIETVTSVVEHQVGNVVQRTFTETYDGGGTDIRLRHSPVISITSVVEAGTTLPATDYDVLGSAHPMLIKSTGMIPLWWAYGIQNIVVTYKVGRVIVPANITLGGKIILQHMWETQRSSSSGRRPPGIAADLAEAADEFGRSFAVPRRALELLVPDVRWNYA
jgi:hypothetical protein